MDRTKILKIIVFALILMIASFLIVNNYSDIQIEMNRLVGDYVENKPIIPKDVFNNRNYSYDTVNTTTNFEPSNIEDIKKIYYSVLNNGWSSFTFYCNNKYPTCVNDVKRVADESNYVLLINNYVSPYNAYKKYNTLIVNDNEVYLTIEKLYTSNEILKIDDYVNQVIEELKINTKRPAISDLKKIHNYLIQNITYDDNYNEETKETISNKANGALFNGIALCSGYTDAFALFLDKLNIPNFKVTSEKHIWTVVYFDNKWQHIDLTWDDDEINENNNFNFFLISTKELWDLDSKEHTFEIDNYLELK